MPDRLQGGGALGIAAFWRLFHRWKLPDAKTVHSAVYSAALSLTDEEIETVVRDALRRARRDLSS